MIATADKHRIPLDCTNSYYCRLFVLRVEIHAGSYQHVTRLLNKFSMCCDNEFDRTKQILQWHGYACACACFCTHNM